MLVQLSLLWLNDLYIHENTSVMSEALHWALIDGDVELVQQLLDSGVKPDEYCIEKPRVPVCVALDHDHEDIALLLLKAGANFRDCDSFSYSEHMKAPIHYAAARNCMKVLQYLSDNGADIDREDYTMITPLHYAASYGHIEVVRWLVKAGADISHCSKSGRTALWKAAERGHADIVKYLHSFGAKVNVQNLLQQSILYDCIHNAEMMSLLISLGADLNVKDISGQHVLHVAAASGHTKSITVLLNAGAEVNFLDDVRNTPLHAAAIYRQCNSVRCLLNNGADLNALNQVRLSPVNMALRESHWDIVDLLYTSGCMLSARELADLDRHFRLDYQLLAKMARAQMQKPRSLMNLCMLVIRQCLHTNIDSSIKDISLPQQLKNYVTLYNFTSES